MSDEEDGLRQHPDVEKVLDKWWESCLMEFDDDGNGTIERDEYLGLYKRLVFGTAALHGTSMDLDESVQAHLERDWTHDSGGSESIDRKKLCNSIFELAESWSTGDTPELFAKFLHELHCVVFEKSTVLQPPRPDQPEREVSTAEKKRRPKTEKRRQRHQSVVTIPRVERAETAPRRPRPVVKKRAPKARRESVQKPVGVEKPIIVMAEAPPPEPVVEIPKPPPVDVSEKKAWLQRLEQCRQRMESLALQAQIAYVRCGDEERLKAHEIRQATDKICTGYQAALQHLDLVELKDHVQETEQAMETLALLSKPPVRQMTASASEPVLPKSLTEFRGNQNLVNALVDVYKASNTKPTSAGKPKIKTTCSSSILRHVEIDLPAMKIYCERVHPPMGMYTTGKLKKKTSS